MKLHKTVVVLAYVLMCAYASVANAKRIDGLVQGGIDLVDAIYWLVTAAFTLAGVWLVVKGLWGLYQASTERSNVTVRQSLVAFFVGGALTSLGVIAVMISNTLIG